MKYKGKTGEVYDLEPSPFAQGGEGKVFNIIGKPNMVAKLYKNGLNDVSKERKLLVMVNNPPSKAVMSQIAWPLDVLYDGSNTFVGFVMPKLAINEDLNVIYEYGTSSKYPNITWGNKITIAKNLCAVLDAVHKAGHTVGDLNPKNISVDPRTGRIVFVDTDSYHIEDNGNVYRCNVGMPEYLPVEIQKKMKGGLTKAPLPTFTQESDNFALAIHIFQLLMNGCHPFSCRVLPSQSSVVFPQPSDNIINGDFPFVNPKSGTAIPVFAPSLSILPNDMQALFIRAFIDGHKRPQQRPSPEEWFLALSNLEKELITCQYNNSHQYLQSMNKCPWCEVDKIFNGGNISSKNLTKIVLAQSTYKSNATITTQNTIKKVSYQKTKSNKRKVLLSLIIIIVILISSGFGGYYYKKGLDAANQTSELISALPDEGITNYSLYKDSIQTAYDSYNSLTEWEQRHVKNKDKLLHLIPLYNEYQVSLLRTTALGISEETVADSNVLGNTVKLYAQLDEQQKSLLSDNERTVFENYVKVYSTIQKIDEINRDLIDKYDQINSVEILYLSIDEKYRSYVYNYDLISTFEEQVAFLSQFTFTLKEDKGYSIKAKENVSFQGTLSIPDVYKNKDVIEIEANAFIDQRRITAVTIPKSVLKIGSGAFAGCNNIAEMTLPFVGETDSDNSSFKHIFGSSNVPQSIKKVTITNQSRVKDSAFADCNHIEKVNYIYSLTYIGNSCFKGCEELLCFNSEENGTLNLLGDMDAVGANAFQDCISITKIIFSDEILFIGNYAFSGCKNINSLDLTNRITQIGDYAFQGLKKLTEIKVYDSTEIIGRGAFKACDSLEKIIVPFVGNKKNTPVSSGNGWTSGTFYEYHKCVLGFIFDYESRNDARGSYSNPNYVFVNRQYGNIKNAIWQFSYYFNRTLSMTTTSLYYYIPTSLRIIVVTNQTVIPEAAFNGCTMLTDICFVKGIDSQGTYSFQNCNAKIWTSISSIQFNTNGGSSVVPIEEIPGKTIELPIPIKENYLFMGWQTKDGNRYDTEIMPEEDIELIAKWQSIISFDTNNLFDVSPISQEENSDITLPILEREGYYFAGWYLNGEKIELMTMPSESMNLKAGWKKIITKTQTLYNGGNSFYKYSGLPYPSINSPLFFEVDYRNLLPSTVLDKIKILYEVDMCAGVNISEIRLNAYNGKNLSNEELLFCDTYSNFTTNYYTYSSSHELLGNGILYLCFYTPNGYNGNYDDKVMRIRKLTYSISYPDQEIIY